METAFGPLFNSLSFTLKKGDRIGLIGHERLRQKHPAAGAGRHPRAHLGQRLARRSVSDGPR
ncbi:hypothetical protein LNP24_10580 [Klebsiella pneumoniae subsp. pneumoniae]|nr:hypothetical protein [Klebsiella pneumoniae subsp. pneumoniae]